MQDPTHEVDLFFRFIRILLAWSLLSLGGGVIGLYARPREVLRGFWFMGGLWGLIDGLIALAGLFGPPVPPGELRSILGINGLLDAGYLAVGSFLLTRGKPVLRGFGAAIVVQGGFLLIFDASFWFLCKP